MSGLFFWCFSRGFFGVAAALNLMAQVGDLRAERADLLEQGRLVVFFPLRLLLLR
ncbi:MAG TPA: hypothetical protein H9867_09915 [Candidatus Corynebacterium gallistercoris]|uniref:Uncharacterized protein n=1 Tax=Candidatus Corynebacterium gallistercoris TaxID=2838530 RepID=A0A9D1RZQ3_9CORY|nr:hypothetical protein [Candidatus Corynebacterium gallistercoris]